MAPPPAHPPGPRPPMSSVTRVSDSDLEAFSRAEVPPARRPLSSITSEVSLAELAPLLDASRKPEEKATAPRALPPVPALSPPLAAARALPPVPAVSLSPAPAPRAGRGLFDEARFDDSEMNALFGEEPPSVAAPPVIAAPVLAAAPLQAAAPVEHPAHEAVPSSARTAILAIPMPAEPVDPVDAEAPPITGPGSTLILRAEQHPRHAAPAPLPAPPVQAAPPSPAPPVQAASSSVVHPLAAFLHAAPARPPIESSPTWGPVAAPTARRTPLPPGRRRSSLAGVFVAVGGATLLAVAVGAVIFSVRQQSPATSAAAPSSAASAALTAGGAGSASGASAAAAPSASGAVVAGPEGEARAALARLRDGIGACVREVIAVLPGTSPAVPAVFASMQGGVYKSVARDFRSPVFACAKYRESEPQRFQIQWQLVVRPNEGRGVAWIDDDGDGQPDRAFGFPATLVHKNEVQLGDVVAIDPMPAPLKPME